MKTNKNENEQTATAVDERYVSLESVGTMIDSRNGMTYPMVVETEGWIITSRTPDLTMGRHYDSIENDGWFEALSETDKDLIENVFDRMAERYAKSRGI